MIEMIDATLTEQQVRVEHFDDLSERIAQPVVQPGRQYQHVIEVDLDVLQKAREHRWKVNRIRRPVRPIPASWQCLRVK